MFKLWRKQPQPLPDSVEAGGSAAALLLTPRAAGWIRKAQELLVRVDGIRCLDESARQDWVAVVGHYCTLAQLHHQVEGPAYAATIRRVERHLDQAVAALRHQSPRPGASAAGEAQLAAAQLTVLKTLLALRADLGELPAVTAEPLAS